MRTLLLFTLLLSIKSFGQVTVINDSESEIEFITILDENQQSDLSYDIFSKNLLEKTLEINNKVKLKNIKTKSPISIYAYGSDFYYYQYNISNTINISDLTQKMEEVVESTMPMPKKVIKIKNNTSYTINKISIVKNNKKEDDILNEWNIILPYSENELEIPVNGQEFLTIKIVGFLNNSSISKTIIQNISDPIIVEDKWTKVSDSLKVDLGFIENYAKALKDKNYPLAYYLMTYEEHWDKISFENFVNTQEALINYFGDIKDYELLKIFIQKFGKAKILNTEHKINFQNNTAVLRSNFLINNLKELKPSPRPYSLGFYVDKSNEKLEKITKPLLSAILAKNKEEIINQSSKDIDYKDNIDNIIEVIFNSNPKSFQIKSYDVKIIDGIERISYVYKMDNGHKLYLVFVRDMDDDKFYLKRIQESRF
ncbi:hypothetical protein [Croceivirga radicis]|uniref:hypothetical protein n=1 Tax=Croceivirga radicis TaxID=1929488 RepID=UPI000255B866|nr:hypothetical protein [Croceivirga radicis]